MIRKFFKELLKKNIMSLFEKIFLKYLFKKNKLIKTHPMFKNKYIIAISVAFSGLLKKTKNGIDIISKKKFTNVGILIKK